MKKILIVDDSLFMRTVLKDLLNKKDEAIKLIDDIEIYEADGKMSTLEHLRATEIDLLLLDIVMPEGELAGLELVETIRNILHPQKIIIISALQQTFTNNECKRLEIGGYIQKPFQRDEIIKQINKCLAAH